MENQRDFLLVTCGWTGSPPKLQQVDHLSRNANRTWCVRRLAGRSLDRTFQSPPQLTLVSSMSPTDPQRTKRAAGSFCAAPQSTGQASPQVAPQNRMQSLRCLRLHKCHSAQRWYTARFTRDVSLVTQRLLRSCIASKRPVGKASNAPRISLERPPLRLPYQTTSACRSRPWCRRLPV